MHYSSTVDAVCSAENKDLGYRINTNYWAAANIGPVPMSPTDMFKRSNIFCCTVWLRKEGAGT